ncbi:hypothetical protein ACTXT7_004965 [Hymenolepis weldensis]
MWNFSRSPRDELPVGSELDGPKIYRQGANITDEKYSKYKMQISIGQTRMYTFLNALMNSNGYLSLPEASPSIP